MEESFITLSMPSSVYYNPVKKHCISAEDYERLPLEVKGYGQVMIIPVIVGTPKEITSIHYKLKWGPFVQLDEEEPRYLTDHHYFEVLKIIRDGLR